MFLVILIQFIIIFNLIINLTLEEYKFNTFKK